MARELCFNCDGDGKIVSPYSTELTVCDVCQGCGIMEDTYSIPKTTIYTPTNTTKRKHKKLKVLREKVMVAICLLLDEANNN